MPGFNARIRARLANPVVDPEMTLAADKLRAKQWAWKEAGIMGVPPRCATTANSFVLKPNHSSGRMVVVKDGRVTCAMRAGPVSAGDDVRVVREKMPEIVALWKKAHTDPDTRERWYRPIRFAMVCEEYLEDPRRPGRVTPDYKFHVVGGEVVLVQVHYGRIGGGVHYAAHFSRDYKIDPNRSCTNPGLTLLRKQNDVRPKPPTWEAMVKAAETIGSKWGYARVDLYENGPFLSEVTFAPNGGHVPFKPVHMDADWGLLWYRSDEARSEKGGAGVESTEPAPRTAPPNAAALANFACRW